MQTLTLIAFYLVLAFSPTGSPVCDSIEENGKTAVREEPTPSLNTTAAEIYYFHPDHLGSSAWVTDTLGHAVQHLGYMPWGEKYISQKTGNFSTIYTFSGKERDDETGYSYFGQRFYDSELSFWLSVDPLRIKYPSFTPFNYCANNPIKLVDPNGEEVNPIFSTTGELLGTDNKGWKGTAIVMKEEDYYDNMSHDEACKVGIFLDKYGEGISISDETWNEVEKQGGERMKPYVKNKSNETIYYKPEGIDRKTGEVCNPGYDENGSYKIGPHKDLYARVDGIKTSRIPDNKVYKVPSYLRVVVNEQGVPDIKYFPLESIIKFTGIGGVINCPDAGWEKLSKSKPVVH